MAEIYAGRVAADAAMPPRYNLKFELTDGQTDTEPML